MIRALLLAAGGGAFTPNFVAKARQIIEQGPPGATAYVYTATDDRGKIMGFFRVVDDGIGGYVCAYAWSNVTNDWWVEVASASSPVGPWTYEATIEAQAHSGTIEARADGSFVVAYEKDLQTYSLGGNYIVVRVYDDLADLLTGTYSDSFDVPRTLATSGNAEGTPTFYDANDPMDISFHYNVGGGDFEARGTLTGMASWSAGADTALNTALTGLGEFTRGRLAYETRHGQEVTIVEAATDLDDFGTWRLFWWDGTAAEEITVTTHGGSTSQAVPSLSVLDRPGGNGKILCVSVWFFADGGATGEPGLCIYYRPIP